MSHDIWFYGATVVAVTLLGFAKGGLAGAGLLATPLMTLVMPPFQAGAILLPILLMQDAVTVAAFRKSWDKPSLRRLVPAGVMGVMLAWLLSAWISARIVEAAIGLIAMLFAVLRMLRPKGGAAGERPAAAWLAGIASGFTSQIAHAGAPPFQIYMLGRRLPAELYLGTAAFYFTAIDIAKVPAFLALGQLRAPDLMIAAAMAPVAVGSSWAGVFVMRRLPVDALYRIVSVMLFLVGLVLFGRSLIG